MRKPLVTLESIVRNHKLKLSDKNVVRPGGEKLTKEQPKTAKKLG